MSTRDPGPPTWKEACDGHLKSRGDCAKTAQNLKEYLTSGRIKAGDDATRVSTEGLLVKAEAEWVHWNAAHARAVAFIRVHPAMARESIYAKCPHDDGGKFPTCWTGADEGWYALPAAKVVPVASFYEREPGDGTEDEEART